MNKHKTTYKQKNLYNKNKNAHNTKQKNNKSHTQTKGKQCKQQKKN